MTAARHEKLIFLRTDQSEAILNSDISSYAVTPAGHLNITITETAYTDSGYLSVFRFNPNTWGDQNSLSGYKALKTYAELEQSSHLHIIIIDPRSYDSKIINLDGGNELTKEGRETSFISIKGSDDTDVFKKFEFDKKFPQIFSTSNVKVAIENVQKTRYAYEFLLGGNWRDYALTCTFSLNDGLNFITNHRNNLLSDLENVKRLLSVRGVDSAGMENLNLFAAKAHAATVSMSSSSSSASPQSYPNYFTSSAAYNSYSSNSTSKPPPRIKSFNEIAEGFRKISKIAKEEISKHKQLVINAYNQLNVDIHTIKRNPPYTSLDHIFTNIKEAKDEPAINTLRKKAEAIISQDPNISQFLQYKKLKNQPYPSTYSTNTSVATSVVPEQKSQNIHSNSISFSNPANIPASSADHAMANRNTLGNINGNNNANLSMSSLSALNSQRVINKDRQTTLLEALQQRYTHNIQQLIDIFDYLSNLPNTSSNPQIDTFKDGVMTIIMNVVHEQKDLEKIPTIENKFKAYQVAIEKLGTDISQIKRLADQIKTAFDHATPSQPQPMQVDTNTTKPKR